MVQSLEFDPLILSQLDAYARFEETELVMFLKLETWKKGCIFKGAPIFQELGSLLALGRILSRSSALKIFLPHK